jgi:hypothetical protein
VQTRSHAQPGGEPDRAAPAPVPRAPDRMPAGNAALARWIELDGERYDARSPLSARQRQTFREHVVAPREHADERDALVDRTLDDILGQRARWTIGQVQTALVRDWRAHASTLAVPIPAADVGGHSIAQAVDTVLRNFYTYATLSINGTRVHAARSTTDEGLHAEDVLIAELDKAVNWRNWTAQRVATGRGDVVHIQLNNSPCFERRRSCARRLIGWLAERRRTDPDARLRVSFMNPYHLDSGEFDASIAAMEDGGVETAVVGGGALAQAVLGRAPLPEETGVSRSELQELTARRLRSDANALAAYQHALGDRRRLRPARAPDTDEGDDGGGGGEVALRGPTPTEMLVGLLIVGLLYALLSHFGAAPAGR